MGGGGRMACCSAPPASPTRRSGGAGRSSLAAAVAARRKQQGLPPLSPVSSPRTTAFHQHNSVATDLATDSAPSSPRHRSYADDPYKRRVRSAHIKDSTKTQRIDAAESEAVVADVAVAPGGYGMFVSRPRQTRQGELSHWCQLYRDGTFRHGCTLGETAHEHMGPPEAASRFVVEPTVNVEIDKHARTVQLALQCWQVSNHALDRRRPDEELAILPGDWVQANAMKALLRCPSDPADHTALVIENWARSMGPTVPPPDRQPLVRRAASEQVSWWSAAEFHSRMVWDPDRAPPEPPTCVHLPPAPIVPAPRARHAQFPANATTAGTDSLRNTWREQKSLYEILDQIAGVETNETEKLYALRALNELITLDSEAKQSFVERCTEDPALELAIRSLLPAVAAPTGTHAEVPQSPTTAVRRAVQAQVPYEVHAFSGGAVENQGRPETADSEGGGDAKSAAQSAQFARLSNLT